MGEAAVGMPGLVALVIGGGLFFLLLARMRLRAGSAAAGDRRSSASAVGIALQMLGFAAAGFGGFRVTLPPTSGAAIAQAAAVTALIGTAVALFAAATSAMRANWSLVARTRADHELVTSGVFGHLRHPIYTGMASFLFALAVGFGHYPNLALALPLFAAGTWIRVREEEKLLRAHFGSAYDAYAARVKRFVPGLL